MFVNNKVLIKLTVPEIDETFDIFIPVNEVTWKIKKMLIKSVNDMTGSNFNLNNKILLIRKDSGRIYGNNEIIIDSDIRNACELLLLTI